MESDSESLHDFLEYPVGAGAGIGAGIGIESETESIFSQNTLFVDNTSVNFFNNIDLGELGLLIRVANILSNLINLHFLYYIVLGTILYYVFNISFLYIIGGLLLFLIMFSLSILSQFKNSKLFNLFFIFFIYLVLKIPFYNYIFIPIYIYLPDYLLEKLIKSYLI